MYTILNLSNASVWDCQLFLIHKEWMKITVAPATTDTIIGKASGD